MITNLIEDEAVGDVVINGRDGTECKRLETEVAFQALHETGGEIAIDDFGTGYSSLARLPRFPVTLLKIDRFLVWKRGEDNFVAVLVKSMIDLSHTMGMQIVAEGIETELQERMLQGLGCDVGRGYFYARWLDPDSATACLADHTSHP